MIMWLASYPKSGNTWVRALLTNYLYNENYKENAFSKLDMIKSFPQKYAFKGIVDEHELEKNYMMLFKYFIKAQKKINRDNNLHIIKTHNICGSVNNFDFTDKENTMGSIYILRDPRSIAVSYAYHANISFEKSVEIMMDEKRITLNNKIYPEARSSWKIHLKSWLNHPMPKIFIKYEELETNTHECFKSILGFINKFIKKKIEINDERILETVKNCSFDNLSDLEKKLGFAEKGKNVNFFRKGKTDEWKTALSTELISKIEKEFSDELKEFKYY